MDDPQSNDEKARWSEALRRHLKTAKALRLQANQAPAAARKRLLLREWQAARLARSYAELLPSERFGQAARFFLSDLYGPKDFSSRDEEVERILPLLVRLLPATALQTIALAIEVDALTENLDAAMVVELDRAGAIDCIDEVAYTAAYRQVGRRAERERQIVLIRATGEALERLARNALLTGLLKVMRAPAQLAGLGDLHRFLASGFTAFRHMGNAVEFLDRIESTERKLLRNMFSNVENPFAF